MTASTVGAQSLLRLRGISKRFGVVQALSDVDLDVDAGSVHGLVGANGAGKSTLGKVIAGVYAPDAGQQSIGGESVSRWTPQSALAAGVAMIHQELTLVPTASVLDNVLLGIEVSRFGFLSGDARGRYEELSERCDFALSPSATVANLSIADCQKVEIMRALAREARIIVMDEPTSALTPDEAEKLHRLIRSLRDEGVAIVYVSHFLEMVLEVADQVTVLRNGERVKSGPAADESEASLVEAMMGASVETSFPEPPPLPAPDGPPLLRVERVSSGILADVDLVVERGEIVGIAGLVGSGRTEILRAICGVDRVESGAIELDGDSVVEASFSKLFELGVAMVPEDRRGQGLVMTMNVADNIALPHVSGELGSWGFVRGALQKRRVAEMLDRLGVVPPLPAADINGFSGGNQQKILFSKWLLAGPRLLLLDEPTRGVDVAAKRAIYRIVVDLAAEGVGILLVSSELEEVIHLAHRVEVVSQGRNVASLPRQRAVSLGVDGILEIAFGTSIVESDEGSGR